MPAQRSRERPPPARRAPARSPAGEGADAPDLPRAPAQAQALAISTARGGALRFEVLARPRARGAHGSRVVGARAGALVVHLSAPPVDGAANEALVALLSSLLGVPRRQVLLVRGERARSKLVEVHGLHADELRARLGSLEAV